MRIRISSCDSEREVVGCEDKRDERVIVRTDDSSMKGSMKFK